MRLIIAVPCDRFTAMLPIRDVNPTLIRPLLTWGLIAINVAVFFLVQPQSAPEADEFAYRNAAISCELATGEPLSASEIRTGVCSDNTGEIPVFAHKSLAASVLFSMFLHAGFLHLGFNMWSLWIFGNNVEEAFGHAGYVLLYLLGGVAATFGFVAINPDLTVPLVGASGAIAAVMGAYLVLFPSHQVMTLIFFRIVAIRSVFFLGIWFVSQFLFTDGNVAWEAHVAGFLFGVVVTLPFRRRLLANTASGQRQFSVGY
jgi:membrane associated rhomboid family serine protease